MKSRQERDLEILRKRQREERRARPMSTAELDRWLLSQARKLGEPELIKLALKLNGG